MRLYSSKTAPFDLPTLTTARVCIGKHYLRTEHIATGRIQEFEDKGHPLAQLAAVINFPDPLEEEKPIHNNLNIPLRKPPTPPAKPAAVVAAPAAAAAAVGPAAAAVTPATSAPAATPAAAPAAGAPNGGGSGEAPAQNTAQPAAE